MGKVSRSALLSGAFHVRWPRIYSARYLSSFAYRLSKEHLSIIKRRYLFLSTYEAYTVDPLSRRGSPRAVIRRRISEKKSVTQTGYGRILHELPARYRSRHSRRARQVLEFGFQRRYRSVYTRLWSEHARSWRIAMTFREVLRVVAVVEDRSVWSLKKTLRSCRTKRSGGARNHRV